MKYSFVVACLFGVISGLQGHDGDHGQTVSVDSAPYSPQTIVKEQRDPYDVEADQAQNLDSVNDTPLGESLSSGGLKAIHDNYLKKDFPFDKTFKHEGDQASNFLDTEAYQKNILNQESRSGDDDINNQYERNDYLIDRDASNVKAAFESCHVGETIIPAIKEQTQVKQAANYNSNQNGNYELAGDLNNDYKLTGQLSYTGTIQQNANVKGCKNLSLRGNKNKKYRQCGSLAMLGNRINSEEDHNNEFCLKGDILDEEATDVRTNDPDAKVKEEVDQVVRTAISRLISQAIQFALDETLDHTISVQKH